MNTFTNPDVAEVFNRYPDHIRKKLLFLRELIFDTASQNGGIGQLVETLKWGEPSYVTINPKTGSTVRIGFKISHPNRYALHFHCGTSLIDTFREIYANDFKFEGKRAIVFDKDDLIPTIKLKHCIALALTYHRVKHLPNLGM